MGIIEKKLHINNRKKDDVVKDLTRLKFQKFGDTKEPRTGFEYLLIMQIASLTKERKEELERMAKDKATELEKVKRTSIQQMWLADLERLEDCIKTLYDEDENNDTKKRKRGRRGDADQEARQNKGGEEADEGEANDNIDPFDNPFGDIGKWTNGALASLMSQGPPQKRRRA